MLNSFISLTFKIKPMKQILVKNLEKDKFTCFCGIMIGLEGQKMDQS